MLAWEYAAALMRVTLGVSMGLPVEEVPEVPGQSPEGSEGVPTMEVSRQRVSSWIHAAMVAGKRCCPIPSQSRDCSG